MRTRWQLTDFRAAVYRHWRVRPATLGRADLASGLELHPLEERRVLSAAAALAMAQALAADGLEQVEGTAKSPDPATPLGTDAAHQEPIDPGNRTVQGDPTASQDDTKGPAAENLNESENRSTAAGVEAEVQAEVELSLVVSGNQSVDEGAELSIPNIGSFTDNRGVDVPEYTYSIDWGDHTPATTGAATIDATGGGLPTLGSFDGAHTYADNGTYTVLVTISDGLGGFASEQFTVSVNNVAPTLTVTGNKVTTEGSELSITDIFKFSDPGFDNPLNVGGETQEQFTYVINWGDSPNDVFGLAPIDVHGSKGTLTQGSLDAAHTYADNGTYTVKVTVSDDDGASVTKTFTVTVRNVEPTLTVVDDQEVDEGTELSITDLGKFSDPGFDNLANLGERQEQFTYAINWGDGTDEAFGPPTIDVHGQPGIPTQGSFDGTHTYADNGVYTVTVSLSDDDGATVTETFTVTVRNVDPVLTVVDDQLVDEGTELVIPNIGTFTDPGFDNSKNVGGETQEQFTYTINWGDGTEEDFGPAMIDVHGQPGIPTQGSFDGSHIYADNGVYTVTVTINDDDGGSDVQTFTVTVRNVDPEIVTVAPDQEIDEGALLDIPEIATFTDPGFDNPLNVGGETREQFTYTINWGDGTEESFGPPAIDVIGGPNVPNEGSISGRHIYADNGTYTVTITINDDDGGSDVATLTVHVRNVAPELVVPTDCQIADANGTVTLDPSPRFTDPGFDNSLNVGGETVERFTYSIDWGDGTTDFGPVTDFTTGHVNPGGLSSTPSNGQFPASHTYTAPGKYTVTVTVSDDDGGSDVQTFCVKVPGDAGQLLIVTVGDQEVDEGALLDLTPIATFEDSVTSQPYTYTINWGDGHSDSGVGTIDAIVNGVVEGRFNGSHIYADNGPYNVVVTVVSADGRSAVGTFVVTVSNVAPVLTVSQDCQTVQEGSPVTLDPIPSFSDPGFDNSLNVGGETVERFTYSIDWGDGSDPDVGPVTDFTTGHVNDGGLSSTPSTGTFPGSHTYSRPGTYVVTIKVFDDDGGCDTATVCIKVEASRIVVRGEDQTIDEGSLLDVDPLAIFSDTRSGASGIYTYTIDWGDGLPIDSGSAALGGGEARLGSIAGAHTYADNGLYHVTVTVFSADGRSGEDTLQVRVDNVAPTITEVSPNQTVPLGSPVLLLNMVRFNDPGFDNPLNVGGETTETFTYKITWGDTPLETTGDGRVDVLGAIGAATRGSLDSGHLYAGIGTFDVNVTVFDDDGGSATATLQVTVFFFPPPPPFLGPPGGGTINVAPPVNPRSDALQLIPPPTSRFEQARVRIGSVAGAELRLVMRIVLPEGLEDLKHDERLQDEVLDNLRGLFKRLPDGHYRIYLIQADDIERLVVDVVIEQGRSITLFDDSESLRNELRNDQAPPAAEPAVIEPKAAEPATSEASDDAGAPIDEAPSLESAGMAFSGGLGAALLVPLGRARRVRPARHADPLSLKKAHRILRRAR